MRVAQGSFRGPDDVCVLAGGRGGWVVGGTMDPSPSTDRQYRDLVGFSYIKPVLMRPVLGT